MTETIQPWYAAAVQMPTEILWPCSDDEVAAVIAHNMEVATESVRKAVAAEPHPSLVLLPEYAFSGQPDGGTVADWLARGCSPIPGPITAHFADLARELGIYLGGNQFETDPEWPDRFFNTSWLIDPDGRVILRYRRVHTAIWCSPHDVWDDYLTRYGAWTPCGLSWKPHWAASPWCPAVRSRCRRSPARLRCAVPRCCCTPPGRRVPRGRMQPIRWPRPPTACRSCRQRRRLVPRRSGGQPPQPGHRRQRFVVIIAPSGAQLAAEERHVPAILKAEIDIAAMRALRSDLSMANPLLRLRTESIAETYRETIYPPNAFLDMPLREYGQIDGPARQALEYLGKRTVGGGR